MTRNTLVLFALAGLLLVVVSIFWQQELKFLLPTPVPTAYQPVATGESIDLHEFGIQPQHKPLLLHFFNPECPCSRFSTAHVASLIKAHNHKVDFKLVLQYASDSTAAQEAFAAYGIVLPIILDAEEALASRCGVYATPQAVILDKTGRLYYRGNYNRSRYCTDKNTSFASQALAAITEGREAPIFSALATTAYGCPLNKEEPSFLSF